MHEFDSAGLVTGFIKQLLATFELPTIRVYTTEFEQYYEKYAVESPYVIESFNSLSANVPAVGEGEYDNLAAAAPLQVDEKLLVPYLKDGRIQFQLGGYYTSDNTFVPGKWQDADLDVNKSRGGFWNIYNRGAAYLNQTKRLQIRNNIYDSYTHEYLGNYLRFLRDYDNLDLMSLYNCFSNRLCTASEVNIKLTGHGEKYGQFNAGDPNYKIYRVPVKLFKNYTIAIDSAAPVEICCGIYGGKLNSTNEDYKKLLDCTYCRIASTRFNQPFLYSALTDLAPKKLPQFPKAADIKQHSEARKFIAKLADREPNLVLLLKVQKDVDSSIVILEGDYRKWNDFSASFIPITSASSLSEKKIQLQHNHTVIANEGIYSDLNFSLIAPLQLLQLNTGKQMPFADRLLEYLLEMCITGAQDEPRENVLMAQYVSSLHYNGNTLATKYYIAVPDKQLRLGDIQAPVLIYADRSSCTNIGDYYLQVEKVGDEEVEVLYSYTKTEADQKLGNFISWLQSNGLVLSANAQLSVPLAINQNLVNGVWHPSLRKLFYRYMLNNTDHNFAAHRDLLGYVDKDVEKYFTAIQKDKKTGKSIKKTMLNFNAWEDIEE